MASVKKTAKGVFDQNIQRSKHFMELRRDLLAAGKSEKQVEDVLRAALSWTVAALDAYVHDKISEELVPFIKLVIAMPTSTEGELNTQSKAAADLIGFLEKQEKSERPGHLDYWRYASKMRPFVQIRAQIEKFMLLRSYQEPSNIEAAFNLIGCRAIFDGIAGKQTPARAAIWKDLSAFSNRRNKIVHEGDRMRGRRGSRGTRGMTARYVTKAINRIDEIVKLIDVEVDKQLKALKPAPKARGRKPSRPRGRPRTANE